MNENLKFNLLNIETYKRLAFLLIFVLIFSIVELVVYAIAFFQILFLLFTGSLQEELKGFAKSVSAYLYDIVKFLTFDSEIMPFPFKPWKYSTTVKKDKKTSSDDDTQNDELHS